MKTIVLYHSLFDAATLIDHLQSKKVDCQSIDTQIQKGDLSDKYDVQIPKIFTDTLAQKEIILFSDQDYLTPSDLRKARESGFKIFLLEFSLAELTKRDQKGELSLWLNDDVDFQNELKRSGLIDKSIDATLPVDQIAKELIK